MDQVVNDQLSVRANGSMALWHLRDVCTVACRSSVSTGLVQHEVEIRTREIGIRMALGSTRVGVMLQIIRRVTLADDPWHGPWMDAYSCAREGDRVCSRAKGCGKLSTAYRPDTRARTDRHSREPATRSDGPPPSIPLKPCAPNKESLNHVDHPSRPPLCSPPAPPLAWLCRHRHPHAGARHWRQHRYLFAARSSSATFAPRSSNPQQLVVLEGTGDAWKGHSSSHGGDIASYFSYPMYRDLKSQAKSHGLEDLLATSKAAFDISFHNATQLTDGRNSFRQLFQSARHASLPGSPADCFRRHRTRCQSRRRCLL